MRHRFRQRLVPEVFAIVSRLLALMRVHSWLLPFLVGLNLVSFFFESLGISLLVPVFVLLTDPSSGLSSSSDEGGVFLKLVFALAERFEGPNQKNLLIGLVVLCVLLRSATAYASSAAFAYVSGSTLHSLRVRMFRRILAAHPRFIESRPPGMLLNALGTESWRIAEGVRLIAVLITNGCATLVFVAVMLLISWQLTLIISVGVVLIIATVNLVTASAKRVGNDTVKFNTALTGRIAEGLNGLSTIRLFAREDHESARFVDASEQVRRSFLKLDLVSALSSPVLNLLFAAFLSILIFTTSSETFFSLALCIVLLQRMRPHVTYLVQARVGLMNLVGALDIVSAVIEGGEAAPLSSGVNPARAPERAIRFIGVRHRYRGANEDALFDLNCEIRASATTALVGPSGSGKSTIASLVCRQFDPVEGQVLIDDQPLRSFNLAEWRDRIAVVPQDIYLFNATLRENIAYGRFDASEADIAEVVRIAGASDFVASLPQQLDTPIGDRGTRLSGGQRQRIALARALLRNPDVLILDEATNALDNLAAGLVRDTIGRLSKGRTVLIVAHRMSGIMMADHVIVLNHGRIAEQGSPRNLLAHGGLFSRMAAAEKITAQRPHRS